MNETIPSPRPRRVDYAPDDRIEYPPVFVWPPRVKALVRWLFGWPGYLWPYNALYLLVAVGVWHLATPSTSTMSTWGIGWVAVILVRNAVLLVLWYGIFHLRLYVRKAQDTRFKYNGRFPAARSERLPGRRTPAADRGALRAAAPAAASPVTARASRGAPC